MSLVEVDDLSVAFGAKRVVRNVSFTLDRGETLALVGERGPEVGELIEAARGRTRERAVAVVAAGVHGDEPGGVEARLLVCHGALDPHVPLDHVTAFAEEMSAAGADWQLIMYGGALHGFTHRHAQPGATPGVAYNPLADDRSFAATQNFLADVFEEREV